MTRLRCAGGRDRGATLPIVALLLPVIILMTAFAVDLGRQRSSARTMQARADVIALDMIRLADGRTQNQITGDAGYLAYLQDSATRNDVEVAKLTVNWGTWNQSGTPPFVPSAGGAVPTAVQVTARETTKYFFHPGSGPATRSAVAARQAKAGFSIGSFAAAVSTGASPLLNPLLGDALGLGVLAYDGLAVLDLDLAGIATELGLATPEELFTGNTTALEVLSAQAEILRRADPSAAELIVLDQVIASPSAAALDSLDVEDVIDVSPGSEGAALGSTVNLLDFLGAAAFIANGNAGLTLPMISLGLPGSQIVGGQLSLIQSPTTVYGPVGKQAMSTQAHTTLVSTVGTLSLGNFVVSSLSGLLPGVCGLLLLGPLLCGLTSRAVVARLTTTVDVDLASALGTIADIRCPGAQELDIDVASSLLRTSLGIQVEIVIAGTSAGVIPLSVLNDRPATNGTADFVIPPDAFDVFKPSTPGVGSLTGNTTISGLGGLGTLLTPTLNGVLDGIVSEVNGQLVTPLASMLGARVASADVAARAVDCKNLALVG